MTVDVGDMAPDFDLPTNGGASEAERPARQEGCAVLLSQNRDFGVHQEACGFRDTQSDFSAADTVVIGLSKDEVKRLDKFEKEE